MECPRVSRTGVELYLSISQSYLCLIVCRQGYGSRVGARGSMSLMQDVMANMSKPSSLACAGVIAGERRTLKQVGFPTSALLPVFVFMRFHGGRQGEVIYMNQQQCLPVTPLSFSLGFGTSWAGMGFIGGWQGAGCCRSSHGPGAFSCRRFVHVCYPGACWRVSSVFLRCRSCW